MANLTPDIDDLDRQSRPRQIAAAAPLSLHRRIQRHTTPFTDHANRPASTTWHGVDDDDAIPSFSFQVYTTTNVSFTAHSPNELFTDDVGTWRIDVYQQLPDVWSCIEHQRLERQWRRDHPGYPGKIVEQYDSNAAMGAFIIVIDRVDWYWQGPADDGADGGPLAVWFNPWKHESKRILSGTVDARWMVYEQLEMKVERMCKLSDPNHDLRIVWLGSGMWEWEIIEDDRLAHEEAERGIEREFTPAPPPLVAAHVTFSEGSINLQTGGGAELIYIVYPVFSTVTPVDRISIARRFAAHLQSASVRIVVAPQLTGIKECVDYAAAANTPVGYYRFPYGRRFPEYGSPAGNNHMWEGVSSNRFFLVVLDLVEWEHGDGVCFVWVGQGEDIMLARVGGGMRGVAERLGGLR
ncbi:hypothetical protein Q9L58_009013 [Maublancomyces gigas]|uniref:Uncharacterized protein n=1 Tax=Discina gigas TaxID=1032678 RepID=A0ABR3G827_9PEZI